MENTDQVAHTRQTFHIELANFIKTVEDNGIKSIALATSEEEIKRLLGFMTNLNQAEIALRKRLFQYEHMLELNGLDILDDRIDINCLQK